MTGLLELGLNRTHDTLRRRRSQRAHHGSRIIVSRVPLSVALFLDIELAFTKSVPQLNGAVTATADDLSVVSGEGNGEDIGRVANEASGGETSVEVPETECVVPG